MKFASPWAFLLFIPVVLLFGARIIGTDRHNIGFSTLQPVEDAGKSLRQRFLWLIPALEALTFSALILALARPQTARRHVRKLKEGVAIQMLMDISSSMTISMRSSDGHTRFDVAKKVFEAFVRGNDAGLGGRPDDLIGLITFARYPNTVCPLTFGHDILSYFVKELQIEERPNEDGTAFGDALAIAAARLRVAERTVDAQKEAGDTDYRISSKVVILLTDGENNCGNHLPVEAAALAKKWGVRVHTIGFGDPKSAQVIKTPSGKQTVEAPLDTVEKTLRQVAEMTGGIFRRAHNASSLMSVYKEIDHMEKTRIRELGFVDYHDRFLPFAAAGLVILVLKIVLETTWLRKT